MHRRGILVLLLLLNLIPISAQTRYAANISYGKRHALLDSVIMHDLMLEEDESGDIYEDLYDNWSDSKVNPYGMDLSKMKDSFAIDCREYYPPTLG